MRVPSILATLTPVIPLVLALVLAGGTPPAHAEVEGRVGIRAWGVCSNGLVTSIADAAASGLKAGGPARYLYLGFHGPAPCATLLSVVGTRNEPPSLDDLAGADRAWTFEVRFAGLSEGNATFDVAWTRLVVGGDGLTPVETVRETLVVRPSEERSLPWFPLALVEETGPETCTYRRVLVGLEVELVEDATLADARLAYELWWEHVDAEGTMTTRRVDVQGGQGEVLDLAFEPLRWPVTTDARFDNILEIGGRVEGRVLPGGSLEVTLDVMRHAGVARAGRPRAGGVGAGGEKTFALVDGETVRMELPPVGGGHVSLTESSTRSSGAVVGPVSDLPPEVRDLLVGAEVVVDTAEVYEGHRDALVLTVRRVE